MLIVLMTSLVSMAAMTGGAESPSDRGKSPQELPATPKRSVPRSVSTTGTVTEVMEVRDYTYVEVDIGDRRIWAVGPRTQVAVGDTVFLPPGILVANFFSNHLDRRFDQIYMVQSMRVESGGHRGSD